MTGFLYCTVSDIKELYEEVNNDDKIIEVCLSDVNYFVSPERHQSVAANMLEQLKKLFTFLTVQQS